MQRSSRRWLKSRNNMRNEEDDFPHVISWDEIENYCDFDTPEKMELFRSLRYLLFDLKKKSEGSWIYRRLFLRTKLEMISMVINGGEACPWGTDVVWRPTFLVINPDPQKGEKGRHIKFICHAEGDEDPSMDKYRYIGTVLWPRSDIPAFFSERAAIWVGMIFDDIYNEFFQVCNYCAWIK